MLAGLLSELRIKLRDEQPASLVKSSLLNTFISRNEAQIFHVQDSSTKRELRQVDKLSSALSERPSPMQLSYRYETETAAHLHPIQERGELKFIAPDDEFRFLLQRMDGYLDYSDYQISCIGMHAWMYLTCVCLAPLWLKGLW